VQKDFTDDEGVADYTVGSASKEAKIHSEGLFDLLTRVNMARDSMDEDEDTVLSMNFSAVGCILLEFTNALSQHMVSDDDSCRSPTWQTVFFSKLTTACLLTFRVVLLF
jgi:hypothetical protein